MPGEADLIFSFHPGVILRHTPRSRRSRTPMRGSGQAVQTWTHRAETGHDYLAAQTPIPGIVPCNRVQNHGTHA